MLRRLPRMLLSLPMLQGNPTNLRQVCFFAEAQLPSQNCQLSAIAKFNTCSLTLLLPDLGLEMPSLNHCDDLEILKKIASGAIVQLAEQGRLSDLEEQQLLGLTADEYCALRGMQVPGSTKLSHGIPDTHKIHLVLPVPSQRQMCDQCGHGIFDCARFVCFLLPCTAQMPKYMQARKPGLHNLCIEQTTMPDLRKILSTH